MGEDAPGIPGTNISALPSEPGVDLEEICEDLEEDDGRRGRGAHGECGLGRVWRRPRRGQEGIRFREERLPPLHRLRRGGFDDKSFNQLSFEGIKDAAKELGTEYKDVQSKTDQDYAPNLENLVGQGCKLIVTVGFALSAATVESAKANPNLEYVLIDDAADNDFDGNKDADNIKPILYDTAQAAFLAGYAAADYTKTGVVGTYGGQPFPTVTIFMDGFKQGVDYYNQKKGKDVKLIGWEGNDKGVFTGGFDANEKATNTAKSILDKNADVILPVGGPIYQARSPRSRTPARTSR